MRLLVCGGRDKKGDDYSEWMRKICDAPFDASICSECGGTGLHALMCCNGFECGCMGLPVDFAPCRCGRAPIHG